VKFKTCFMSLPRKGSKICFWPGGHPRPLGDVASFGGDTPMGIRICRGSGVGRSPERLPVFSPQDRAGGLLVDGRD
jgi:hypothetical protein